MTADEDRPSPSSTSEEGSSSGPESESAGSDPPSDSDADTSSAPPSDPPSSSTAESDPPPSNADAGAADRAVPGAADDSESEREPSTGSAAGSDTGFEANGGSPTAPSPSPSERTSGSLLTRLRTAETGPLFVVREVLTSVAAVAVVGMLLFAVSGVWPPMVAVESGSMEPHMHKGDLVFITEPGRFTPDSTYGDTGVVTARTGAEVGYRSFGGYGSVVVYDDPGRGGPPIIHRAAFYVESGENWYDEANPDYLGATDCEELLNCPAPHAGFITKGDANSRYDQASGIAPPVRPTWVTGIARLRIPYLGWVRLGLAGTVSAQESEPPMGVEPPEDARPSATDVENVTVTATQATATATQTAATATQTAATATSRAPSTSQARTTNVEQVPTTNVEQPPTNVAGA